MGRNQIGIGFDFSDGKRDEDFELFRNHKVKAKDLFSIHEITELMAYEFVRKYHYLGDAKFLCMVAYGMYYDRTKEMVGCATFSLPQGTSSLQGWFGLGNDTKNVFELSRLCMLPELNGTNATSYLLGGSIKELNRENSNIRERCKREGRKMTAEDYKCRAVITLACAQRHVGSIYQVCNFKYYGVADDKSDFFRYPDGKKNPRGKVSNWHGVWITREKKYRYAYILDRSLKCLYEEEPKPSRDDLILTDCCNGTNTVYDKRYGEWYTCPKCTGVLQKIEVVNDETCG